MLALCALLLVIGIASILIGNFVVEKSRIENIIEWNFALLIQLNFLFAWWAFRARNASIDERSCSDDQR